MKPSDVVRRFDVFLADKIALAAPWVRARDANPDWPAHVDATLADLARRLGHGL